MKTYQSNTLGKVTVPGAEQKQPVFRAAFETAIDNLFDVLNQAQQHLDNGEDLAAIGSLVEIDEQFADFNAAFRLFRRNAQNAR